MIFYVMFWSSIYIWYLLKYNENLLWHSENLLLRYRYQIFVIIYSYLYLFEFIRCVKGEWESNLVSFFVLFQNRFFCLIYNLLTSILSCTKSHRTHDKSHQQPTHPIMRMYEVISLLFYKISSRSAHDGNL